MSPGGSPKSTAVVLPPLTTTPTRSPGCGRYALAEERGQGGRRSRLGHDPRHAPERFLRLADRRITHQHDPIDVGLGDGQHQDSDAARSQRVRRDTACFSIDGLPGRQRPRERRGSDGFDTHDPHGSRVPGRDSPDEAATPNGHQQGIEGSRLSPELQTECPLPQQRLDLIVRVHRHGARATRPVLAGCQRIRVPLAADDEVRSVRADPLDLGGGRDRRHEDLRAHAEAHGGIGHRHAVVPSGGGDDSGRWHGAQQQVGEGAPSLERSGVLHQLELQEKRRAAKPDVRSIHFEDRGQTEVGPDHLIRRLDTLAVDRHLAATTATPWISISMPGRAKFDTVMSALAGNRPSGNKVLRISTKRSP